MSQQKSQFEELQKPASTHALHEFLQFIMENKKWWMLPILVVLGAASLLLVAAGTGAAPFIYTLF